MLEGGIVSRDECRLGVVSERVGKHCVGVYMHAVSYNYASVCACAARYT